MTDEKKTCFVVMGFGEKVDFQTGRKLNLDASYHNMIKPTVEEAGLKCIRADEIVHSGVIDVPMYEQLLSADVVIADLSTYNPNAFYELGVRHALRPFSTIIIAEDKLNYPFDVNHIIIRRYKHLGDDIGVGDARKFSTELKQALGVILANQKNDSPVYEFLDGLTPPELKKLAKDVAAQAAQTPQAAPPQGGDVTLGMLMQQADEAQKKSDFEKAKSMLTAARALKPEDPYIIQRLALATYKSKQPTPEAALEEARALLGMLSPETSNDTETLGLWGAVHKRLWNLTRDRAQLNEAVRGYERGFYLRNDYYNGINLAYLLNIRADNAASRAEAITDFVQAERIRREVIEICENWLGSDNPPTSDWVKERVAEKDLRDAKYWIMATLAEAHAGIGDEAEAQKWFSEVVAGKPAPWMLETTQEQMNKLRALLANSPLKYVKEDGE